MGGRSTAALDVPIAAAVLVSPMEQWRWVQRGREPEQLIGRWTLVETNDDLM
jgi:hypothetical protein